MEKIVRNFYGWDITVRGNKFSDRFYISCLPNMNYIFQFIHDELYNYLAMNYAEQNNLSIDSPKERNIVEKWTDNAIQEFIEDISSMKVSTQMDYPVSLFTSLETRLDFIIEKAKKDMENTTPIAYYRVFQDDERFDYRIKI